MNVSVIIPTLNAGGRIGELLKRLNAQTIKPLETIVIDSSSDDETVNIAKGRFARTFVIERSSFGHGKTRNMAAREAAGDVLMFMVQDALPADVFLIERLTAPLSEGTAAASYARQCPAADARPVERFLRLFNYPETPHTKGIEDLKTMGIKTFFMSNVCSAVRRAAFEGAGGFPDVVMNEDMLLAERLLKAGQKVSYVPGARVIHSHDYSPVEQMKRYFDIGVSLRENERLLEAASSEPEGMRFLGGAVRHLSSSGEYLWIPYVFFESAMKYMGYRLGLGFRRLPGWLVRTMSMNGFKKNP